MQAIETRYHGPTDTKDARITVRADAGRMTVPWDHRLDVAGNHCAAARALATRLGWSGRWTGGSLPGAHGGYAFVCSDRRAVDAFTVRAVG